MSPSRTTGPWAALAFVLLCAGCAQGPADIIAEGPPVQAVAGQRSTVLNEDERAELAKDLDATANRQASEGRSATGELSSAMALSVIRQQQEEEARSLLDAATSGEGGSAAAATQQPPPPCDPSDSQQCQSAAQ